MAGRVERDQWRENQIKITSGAKSGARRIGFGNPEAVVFKLRIGVDAGKAQWPRFGWVDDRKVKKRVMARLPERGEIHLPLHRPIRGDVARLPKCRELPNTGDDGGTSAIASGRFKFDAHLVHAFAQQVDIVHEAAPE